jgi:hypothetical protein
MTKEQTTNKCVEKIVRSDKFVENLKFQFLKVLHSKMHEKYNFCCGAQQALKVIRWTPYGVYGVTTIRKYVFTLN